MKIKIIISVICAIAIILLISVAIFATNVQSTVMSRMKKFNELEVVEEINVLDLTNQRNINSIDSTQQNKLKEYMHKNQLIEDDEKDLKIELVTNNITSERFYRMTGNGARIEILQNSGELKTYINSKPTEYVEGTIFNDEKIKKVANEIINTNELFKNSKNYKLIEIKNKTTYYPTVWFENTSNNKLMFMILNPETKEILAVGTKPKLVSENNEIKINEETAKNIAKTQVNLSEEYILSIEQAEVMPNSMFLKSGVYYSNLDIKRNAYIVSFDTEWKLQVYIDATTGEVIGGNCIW